MLRSSGLAWARSFRHLRTSSALITSISCCVCVCVDIGSLPGFGKTKDGTLKEAGNAGEHRMPAGQVNTECQLASGQWITEYQLARGSQNTSWPGDHRIPAGQGIIEFQLARGS